ncbi:MAG: pilus assembly protein PilM [Candidatus Omnitrophica bacterium]|nr:pilus assembly protein PilM [Candidatus Omnitrophota bacterium]MDD5488539.1 pilus assembly protein PilM [Candidatus Omnitrophota bacterium]
MTENILQKISKIDMQGLLGKIPKTLSLPGGGGKKSGLSYGVDVGASSIKVAGVMCKKNKFEVKELDYYKVATVSTEQERYKLVSEMLGKIKQEKKLKSGVHIAISSDNAKMFLHEIPQMGEDETKKAVGWKATQTMANKNQNELTFDYVPVPPIGVKKENMQTVFVVASEKTRIIKELAMFAAAGIEVLSVDVDILAELEALVCAGYFDDDSRVTLLINVGRQESTLCVVQGKAPYFTRNMKVGGEAFSSGNGTAVPDDGGLSRDDIDTIRSIVVSIERDFKFFSYQVAHSTITKFDSVLLTGGGCLIETLSRGLGDMLGVNAVTTKDTGRMEISGDMGKKPNWSAIKDIMPVFYTAIGLAQRGMP